MKLSVVFRRTIFFLIIFFTWKISAQELRFDETIYDFGKIKEENGTVIYRLHLVISQRIGSIILSLKYPGRIS